MIQTKILRFLIENKEDSFSINGIAKRINSDYKLVYINVEKLEKAGLISIKKLGNRNQCELTNNFNFQVLKVEEERKRDLLKNQNFKVINERLKQVKNPFFVFLVFGSYAKKNQKKGSDIDICLITDDKKINSKIHQIIGLIPLDIHLLDFTVDDFIKMLKTKEDNVGKEIMKNNIILYGIENFYELIKNA